MLGFIAGAVVVCIGYFWYARRSKTFSPSHGYDKAVRANLDYFTSTEGFHLAPTRPVQVQPNVYTLAKPSAEAYPEITDDDDGDDQQRIRITEPYEASIITVIDEEEEEEEAGGEIAPLRKNGEGSPAKGRPKLGKRRSLPATFKSGELVHHSPEEFLRKKSSTKEEECTLEFSCFYDTVCRELHITVLQVVGIFTPDESFLRPPKCSVKMRILPEMLAWQWTRKISRTTNPAFNETFIVPGFAHNKVRECTVHFVVLDFDDVQGNVYVIGEVFMPLSELRANRLEKITKRVNPISF